MKLRVIFFPMLRDKEENREIEIQAELSDMLAALKDATDDDFIQIDDRIFRRGAIRSIEVVK